MKKILTVVMAAVLTASACLGFAACGDTTTDGSELQGFDIELAKVVCEKLGVEARFQLISWDAKFTELESKNIDLIWNGMTITDEIKENQCVSVSYMSNKQVAVVRAADVDKYSTVDKIKSSGAKIAAENGSAGATAAEEQLPDNDLAKLTAQTDALNEVNLGTSDIAIIDSVMAGYYTAGSDYKDKLVIVPDLDFGEEEYGIAARKADTGVIDKVNTALSELYADGTVEDLAKTDDFDVTGSLIPIEWTSNGETAGWDYIEEKGTLVIGYTVFAPIAYDR